MARDSPISVARFVAAAVAAAFVGAVVLSIPLAFDRAPDTDGTMSMFVVFIVGPIFFVWFGVGLALVAVLYSKRTLSFFPLLGLGAASAFVVGVVCQRIEYSCSNVILHILQSVTMGGSRCHRSPSWPFVSRSSGMPM